MFYLKKKNCLGNKKSLSLMLSIVALCFKKKKVAVQAPFRHRYRFKSIDLAPVSEKTQTIPIPTMDGLRNHGPLGLDMLKAPPLREKNNCAPAKHARTHTHTQTQPMCWILRSN